MVTPPEPCTKPAVAPPIRGGTPEPVKSLKHVNDAVSRVAELANIRGQAKFATHKRRVFSPEAVLRAIATGKVGLVNLNDPERRIYHIETEDDS